MARKYYNSCTTTWDEIEKDEELQAAAAQFIENTRGKSCEFGETSQGRGVKLHATYGTKAGEERRERHKQELLDILRKTLGNVTTACQKVGVSRQTFYQWRSSDPEFDEAVHDINEMTLDFVEQQMFNEIKKGNSRLIMFYLVNRGRSRGYSQKQEGEQRAPTVNVVINKDEAEY